ncbi:MAG: glycosyltransferase family 39 protein [Nitrososphaerales archaeon]
MMRPRRDTGLLILLLLLVLGIAAALRFYQIDSQSLWADEGNSAALAARSLAAITHDAANDIHPPLYYWLLHLWTRAFGYTEAALRSLSAVLGVLLVLAIAELGRRIHHSVIGLLAGLIAAVAPFQVYYSQEARMYILLALEATVAMLLFWWLMSQEDHRLPTEAEAAAGKRLARVRWLPFSGQLLVVAWTAGLYTHYAFPLIIALCTGLYTLWLIATRRRGCVGSRIVRWLIFLGVTLGLYAPWLGTAVHQLMGWSAPMAAAGLFEQIRTLLATVVIGTIPADGLLVWVGPLFVLALLGALPWPYASRDYQAGGPRMDWMRCLLPLTWLLAPVAMILVLALFREAYLKFLLIGSPAFALLLARGVIGPVEWLLREGRAERAPDPAQGAAGEEQGQAPRGRSWLSGPARGLITVGWVSVTLAVVFAAAAGALMRYYSEPAAARDDYRGISQFVIATAQPNDAVLLDAPGQSEVFEYYYKGELPIYPLPRQRPLDPEQTQADLQELLKYDKVYALYWGANEADPAGVIENWLDQRGYKTLDQWHGNARLAVYVMPERRAPDEMIDDLNATLNNGITLQGYQGWNLSPAAGEVTQLQLRWRADEPPTRRYKVFLQLLDPRNQVIAQRDAEPAGESRPTTTWQAGETVLDNHGVLIPPGTPPGSYRRIVGMYDAETFERLKLPDGSDFISLPPINVQRAKNPPPLDALEIQDRKSFDFGAISLLGHDRYKRGFGHALGTPIKPGDLLHLTFYWRANAAPRADWWFELSLTDATGKSVAELSAPLVSDTYSTTMWQKGEIVRGEHDLLIPADLRPDLYRLSLTLLPDQQTQAGIAYLGTVQVEKP